MKKLLLTAVTSLALVAAAIAAAPVLAQTPPAPGQALEIDPPVLDIRGNPGETIKQQIRIRDISTSKLLVRNNINDFVAAGEDGTPNILLDEGETSPYSIKNWISPLPELTLKPREVQPLTVTVTIPQNAAPGGYYGVIRFTAEAAELTQSGVSLSASIGTLVLLRVNGTAKESMGMEEFYASSAGNRGTLFESAPVQFTARIKNTGNLHEQPRGQITVKDMFGQVVGTPNVNLENRNVLPGSIRKFESPLDETVIGNKLLFGRYTADLVMTYANGQKTTASLDFWVVPYKLIIIVVVSLILAFFLIRFAIRRYNQTIINQSRRSRRR